MNAGRKTLLQAKIDQLKARKDQIQEEIDRIALVQRTELNQIADELTLLLNAQALLEGRPLQVRDVPPHPPSIGTFAASHATNGRVDWSRFDASSIRGLTKLEALVKMAEWAGGTLRMKEIGQVLIDGGQSNQKRAPLASQQTYGTITNSRLFRKTARGEFTLVSAR